MLSLKSGAMQMYVLVALLIVSLLIALTVLFFLDRAMLKRTISEREATSLNRTLNANTNNNRQTNVFEITRTGESGQSNIIDLEILGKGGIDEATARDALRNAPAESIQNAIREKTGKSVDIGKIERARTKALSSEGQQKINEALQRRDEVDLSKIRSKLQQ